jgi:hypothetical protein
MCQNPGGADVWWWQWSGNKIGTINSCASICTGNIDHEKLEDISHPGFLRLSWKKENRRW